MSTLTPKYTTVRRVISRETIENLHTQDEISKHMHLSTEFKVKPQVQWFFCVFIFSVAREFPSRLRITAISTTVARTSTRSRQVCSTWHRRSPCKRTQSIWLKLVKAHFEADDTLTLRKINNQQMSEYTRFFLDNGAAKEEPLEFVVRDLDYGPEKKKPGPFLVQ